MEVGVGGFSGLESETLRQAQGRLWGTRDLLGIARLMAACFLMLAAGAWALAQSPAQDSNQTPVPTGAQIGMGSQVSAQAQAQNAVLSQDDVRDELPVRSASVAPR